MLKNINDKYYCHRKLEQTMTKPHLIFVIILIIAGLSTTSLHSQAKVINNSPKTNFFIIDSLAVRSADSLCKIIGSKNIDKLALIISDHPAKLFLKKRITNCLTIEQVDIYDKKAEIDSTGKIEIWIDSIGVNYYKTAGDKKNLKREIFVQFSAALTDISGKVINLPLHTGTYSDNIPRALLKQVEASPYEFAQNKAPEEEHSFFDSILEPAIVVTSAIVVIIILFTVRSN